MIFVVGYLPPFASRIKQPDPPPSIYVHSTTISKPMRLPELQWRGGAGRARPERGMAPSQARPWA
eukprot:7942637-Alexandrium_andersonii.AAC.1